MCQNCLGMTTSGYLMLIMSLALRWMQRALTAGPPHKSMHRGGVEKLEDQIVLIAVFYR